MEDCAICLETLNTDIINKWTCNHKFHSNCIKQWKTNSCPLCRTNDLQININLTFREEFNQEIDLSNLTVGNNFNQEIDLSNNRD